MHLVRNSTYYNVLFLVLRLLGTVLTSALKTTVNALRVKRTADNVVSCTRQVTDSSASDKHNAVFLKVMADTGDISRYLVTVCKTYSGDLTER